MVVDVTSHLFTSRDWSRLSDPAPRGVEPAGKRLSLRSRWKGFQRARMKQTRRNRQGLRNGRLVVPFDHSFPLPFDDVSGVCSCSPEGFQGSTSMGTEIMGRAGSTRRSKWSSTPPSSTSRDWSRSSDPAPRGVEPAGKFAWLRPGRKGFWRALMTRIRRTRRGVRNGRLVVPFDHSFPFPFNDANAESWTRATQRSPCLGCVG